MNIGRTAAVLAALLFASLNALGAEADACAQAGESAGSADFNECNAAIAAAANADMERALAAATRSAAASPDARRLVSGIKAAQQAWLQYRDKTCELSSLIEGYANAPAKRPGCLSELTRRRTDELRGLERCIQAGGFGGECPLAS